MHKTANNGSALVPDMGIATVTCKHWICIMLFLYQHYID